MKKIFFFLAVIAGLVLFSLFKPLDEKTASKLYAANFAIYDALKAIAPADKEVEMFIPLGQDLHSFQPNPKLVGNAVGSKIFFYVDGAMSGWIERFLHQQKRENFVDIGQGVAWERSQEEDEHQHEDGHHFESDRDPHYWLSISNQTIVAKNIFAVLLRAYPESQNILEANLKKYLDTLAALDRDIKQKLGACHLQDIIVTHNAFTYLAKEYHFGVISMVGVSPQSMANPKKLQTTMELIRKSQYETIFFETFIPDTVAKTIAYEANVKVDVLQPLATVTLQDLKAGKKYTDLMRENVDKIARARQCQ